MTPQRIFYLQTLQKSPIFENSLIFKEISQNYSFLKGLEAALEAAEVKKGKKEKENCNCGGSNPGSLTYETDALTNLATCPINVNMS